MLSAFRQTLAFTRPANATPYASGQRVAAALASSVLSLPLQSARAGLLRRLGLYLSSGATSSAEFRVHVVQGLPTSLAADGATLSFAAPAGAVVAAYDVRCDRVVAGHALGFALPIGLADEPVFAFSADTPAPERVLSFLVEARAAYARAASETVTLAVSGLLTD